MSTLLLLLLAGLTLYVAWWWFIARNAPAIPPLILDENDPAMTDARARAQSTMPRFLSLLNSHPRSGRVKVPFQANSGTLEWLWADVLSREGDTLTVRYMTPPVSHSGRLERVHPHRLEELGDWLVTLPTGKYAGGYTMPVMFAKGREAWGTLPKELELEETKYESDP